MSLDIELRPMETTMFRCYFVLSGKLWLLFDLKLLLKIYRNLDNICKVDVFLNPLNKPECGSGCHTRVSRPFISHTGPITWIRSNIFRVSPKILSWSDQGLVYWEVLTSVGRTFCPINIWFIYNYVYQIIQLLRATIVNNTILYLYYYTFVFEFEFLPDIYIFSLVINFTFDIKWNKLYRIYG